MIPSVEAGKDLMLRVYAKQIGLEHPSWGKAKCYAQAQIEHPELREEFEPTSQPAYSLPPPGKPAVASVSQRLEQILALPKRVEARKPKEEEVFLVYGSNGELVDIELT